MVIRRDEMKREERERRYDGEGIVRYVHLADLSAEKNIRTLSEITLDPGCSIGSHKHDSETEYYIILSGTGVVNDDGKETEVSAGDSIITGSGASHGIKNTGSVPLVFHAVIVTY